jgi:hypothetical protein
MNLYKFRYSYFQLVGDPERRINSYTYFAERSETAWLEWRNLPSALLFFLIVSKVPHDTDMAALLSFIILFLKKY